MAAITHSLSEADRRECPKARRSGNDAADVCGYLASVCAVHNVHEIARRLAIIRVGESDIELGGITKHIHERPEAEASTAVGLQAKIDLHSFKARKERLRANRIDVLSAEVAS